MEPKIIVIEFVDDLLDDAEEVIGRLVTDKDGVEHKVKKGKQGSRLWERWEELDNGKGRAVKLIMDGFNAKDGNTYPFVADFKWVEGELPAAIEPARAGTPDASGTPKATPIDARSKEITSSASSSKSSTNSITIIFGSIIYLLKLLYPYPLW